MPECRKKIIGDARCFARKTGIQDKKVIYKKKVTSLFQRKIFFKSVLIFQGSGLETSTQDTSVSNITESSIVSVRIVQIIFINAVSMCFKVVPLITASTAGNC